MSAPGQGDRDPGRPDKDGFVRPLFAVSLLAVGGVADVYLGGRIVTMVWFVSKSVLGH